MTKKFYEIDPKSQCCKPFLHRWWRGPNKQEHLSVASLSSFVFVLSIARSNALAYCLEHLVFEDTRRCTIKHDRFVLYKFHTKLVCLSKPVNVTDNRKGTSLLRTVHFL